MSYVLKTHKTINVDDVHCSLSVCGVDVPLSEAVAIDQWHQSLPTKISVTISLELSAILGHLGLKEDAKLGLYLTAMSDTGRKIVSAPSDVADNGAECDFLIEPHQLAGRMRLEVHIFCLEEGTNPGEFSPKSLDILATWEFKCELEGELPRGAIEEVDFDGDYRNALWQITKSLPSEPEDWRFADLSSCIRITLNGRFYREIGDQTSYSLALAGDFVWAIIEAALSDRNTLEYILNYTETESGTLLSTCSSAVRAVFGTEDVGEILFKFERQMSLMKSKAQSISSSIVGGANG
jgi:hypothetical protein